MANDSRQKPDDSFEGWGQPATPPTPGDEDSEVPADSWIEPFEEYLPYWLTWRETKIGAAIGAAAIVAATLLLAWLVTLYDSWSLSASVDSVHSTRQADTWHAWRESHDIADRTLADRSGSIRQFFHALGFVVPVSSPSYLRGELRRQRALSAAVLEYRFESEGNRHAAEKAWNAFAGDWTEPSAAATRTYLLLADGRIARALEQSRKANENATGSPSLVAARLEAALAAGDVKLVGKLAGRLRKASSPGLSAGELYLLARTAEYRSGAARKKLLKKVLKRNSDHLAARLERIAGNLRAGDTAGARKSLKKLAGKHGESAAPADLSRLHELFGDALAAAGEDEKARERYQKAIDAAPTRTSAYFGMIDSRLADGELRAASQLLERAVRKGGDHRGAAVRRAEIAYRRGRLDRALDVLDQGPGSASIAPVLRARLLIARGDYASAEKLLSGLPKAHPRHTVARALELAARAAAGGDLSDGAAESIETLAEEHGGDAVVLRSAARYHLHRARRSDGDARDSHLKRARKLLDDAGDTDAGSALTAYLRCEVEFEAGEFEAAAEACGNASARNDAFVPGMLTSARLALRRQRAGRASMMLAELAGAFDRNWSVAAHYLRALFRNLDFERAAAVLERWKGRDEADETERKLLQGRLAYERGDYKQTVALLEEVRKNDTYGDEASLYYAHALVRLGQFEKAEPIIDGLTEGGEWEPVAWAVFAELRRRQEEYLDAIENARIGRANLESDSAPRWQVSQIYVQSALAWSAHRDWDDARVERFLEDAVQDGHPRSAAVSYLRGLYYLSKREGDADRAVRLLERAVRLQPSRCEVVRALDAAYEAANDYGGMRRVDDMLEERCE